VWVGHRKNAQGIENLDLHHGDAAAVDAVSLMEFETRLSEMGECSGMLPDFWTRGVNGGSLGA